MDPDGDNIMNGLQATVRAVEDAGVRLRQYVPGYPITELSTALGCEISVSEKVALEIALGGSATGLRSLVVVKQVGMNSLADPLVISATHSIGSGVVIIAGDDLGPKGSQAEMDSRFYGPLAELPVFDPKSPAALHLSVLEAYTLSEWLRIPVIIRVTARLLAADGPEISARASPGNAQWFERENWGLTARGRHSRHHDRIMSFAEEASESSTLNRLEISGNVGIIASGYPASLAAGLGVSLLALGYSFPLPMKLISRFIEGHRRILVAEEPEPFIESKLAMSPKVRGKLSGHLPRGKLERSDIIRAIESLDARPGKMLLDYESVSDRGYASICDGCPFKSLFSALAAIDAPVAGDAGCAIRATREPFDSADVVYGLGSSIGVASGFSRKGIALIGDYALAHSGLVGLINAIWQKRDVLVIVLKNDVAAMTGCQKSPDLTDVLKALLPVRLQEMSQSDDEIGSVIREELEKPGPRAIVASGRCVKDKSRSL